MSIKLIFWVSKCIIKPQSYCWNEIIFSQISQTIASGTYLKVCMILSLSPRKKHVSSQIFKNVYANKLKNIFYILLEYILET